MSSPAFVEIRACGLRLVERGDDAVHRRPERGEDEVVGVVGDQGDAWRVALQRTAREAGRNDQGAVDPAVAQVRQRRAAVRVVHEVDRVRARRHRVRQLADADRRHAVVLIDDGQLEVLDVAAERIAEDDQLHEREDHRHDDQQRAAPEPAHLTFDDRHGSVHSGPPNHERTVHRRRRLQRVAQRPARCSARTRRPAWSSAADRPGIDAFSASGVSSATTLP